MLPTVVLLVISIVEFPLISVSDPTETAVLPVVRTNGLLAPSPMKAVAVDPGVPADQLVPVPQLPDVLFQLSLTRLVVSNVSPSVPVVMVKPPATPPETI